MDDTTNDAAKAIATTTDGGGRSDDQGPPPGPEIPDLTALSGMGAEALQAVDRELHELWAADVEAESATDADDETTPEGKVVRAHLAVLARMAEAGVRHDPPEDGLDQATLQASPEAYGKVAMADDTLKVQWTGAYVNDLPDSAFLLIEAGGKKDGEGKTVPRSLRHFPVRDDEGDIDLPHLRNAIARIPQSEVAGLDADAKAKLQDKAREMLNEENERREREATKSDETELEKGKIEVNLPDNVAKEVPDHVKNFGKRGMIDIFSGIGGLSLGFERAGFKPVLAMESEERQAATYALNNPGATVLLGDCRKFTPAKIAKAVGKVGLITGGIPCEPFSLAWVGATAEDRANHPKAHLVSYAMDLVEAVKPEAFVFENVERAFSSPQFKKAMGRAEKMGYTVQVWKLVASDFGVAQRRVRGVMVGSKVDVSEPRHRQPVTPREVLAGIKRDDPWHTPSEFLLPEKASAQAQKTPPDNFLNNFVPDGGKVVFQQYRLSATKPAASMVASAPCSTSIHWNAKRYLTPREIARLQGVPDSYKFVDGITPRIGAGFTGDCVPIPLAEAIGKTLAAALLGNQANKADDSVLVKVRLDAPLSPIAKAAVEATIARVMGVPVAVVYEEPELLQARITKAEERAGDEHYIEGVVLEPTDLEGGWDPDAQREVYSADDVRKAMLGWAEAGMNMKIQHTAPIPDGAVKVLETWQVRAPFQSGDQAIKVGTWMLSLRVVDSTLWSAIRSGAVTGFSIGGTARRMGV